MDESDNEQDTATGRSAPPAHSAPPARAATPTTPTTLAAQPGLVVLGGEDAPMCTDGSCLPGR